MRNNMKEVKVRLIRKVWSFKPTTRVKQSGRLYSRRKRLPTNEVDLIEA